MNAYRSEDTRWPRMIAVGALMALLAVPSLAADVCSQWGVKGGHALSQSNNDSMPIDLTLEQSANSFSGSASTRIRKEDFYDSHWGPIVGTIVGNAFEATIYWNTGSIGIYKGQVGSQGLLVGRTFDKTDPGTTADFHAERPFICLASAKVQQAPGLGGLPAKPPPVALGRIPTPAGASRTPLSICLAAQAATKRGSPAALGLREQCTWYFDHPPAKPVLLGRVQPSASSPALPSICDAAKSARARNSPAAPGLERQCQASLLNGASATPAPVGSMPAAAPISPQPLPPAAPLALPAQAPSALR
jgi:hypothetical protein